jgi:hypothetical protein
VTGPIPTAPDRPFLPANVWTVGMAVNVLLRSGTEDPAAIATPSASSPAPA